MSSHAGIIANSSGLMLTHLPIQYLGVPLYKGRAKVEYFFQLMDKFDKRISGWRGRLLSFGGKITLLKSVLNALPIHALSVIKPPQKLIKHLEKSMAAFLWNSEERHRKRWISWSHICRPMDEGGLGIRTLKQVMTALHAKRCWSIIKGDSVWAHYMLRKYGDPSEPTYVLPHHPSPLWRSIVDIFPRVSGHCAWVAGRGNFPIFGVNWCGMILHKPSAFDYIPNISQVIRSPIIRLASGARADIRNFLPNRAKSMLEVMVLNNDKDRICWMLNEDGEFSTKSFWDYYRTRHPIIPWSKYYWNKFIQPRVGAFLWRLSRNALPVDTRLVSMGFHLASRCSCCANPDVESIDHLFVLGETAARVWYYFAHILRLPVSPTNVDELAQVWLHNISLSSPSGICRNIIFGNTLWEIWKQRNDIVFGNGTRNCNSIISRVSATVKYHLSAFNVNSGTLGDNSDQNRDVTDSISALWGACHHPTDAAAAPQHSEYRQVSTYDVLQERGGLRRGGDAATQRNATSQIGAAAAAAPQRSRQPQADRNRADAAPLHIMELQAVSTAATQQRAMHGGGGAATQHSGAPLDVAGAATTHRGETCTGTGAAQLGSVDHQTEAAAVRVGAAVDAAQHCRVHCADLAAAPQQRGSRRLTQDHTSVAAQQRAGTDLDAAAVQHFGNGDREPTTAAAQRREGLGTSTSQGDAAAAPQHSNSLRLAGSMALARHIVRQPYDSWQPPSVGLKLNIDARCGDSSWTSGGGVIRGVNGSFTGAFLFFMEDFVISVPEVEALLFAVNWCKDMNWRLCEIETSSQRLVDIISAKKDTPWKLTYKVRKIQACLSPTPDLRTVSPRANGVAKALVSFAVASKEGLIFSHPSELPPPIRSALDFDFQVH
ncbi:uncharacterized protein M6B38_361025 [Iris pallida]|uniref:RNase H type-1 domain-containing protein n=1 Tax=Iris pallida TaxID=29817 RepID=A0AAX6GKT2_IRIPA|nr:uncharacterized protein M6B38_174090 [Iris pallida]KAJ6812137.1 uncharacterized protein M6B38_152040 [Iris pallida]KAJ6829264.1 uncharacterized protein M6B38_361025 [Iris pallida]